MSTWLTIPSARHDAGTVHIWKKRGYRIALWRDRDDDVRRQFSVEGLVIVAPYPGYAKAVNQLVKTVLERDPLATFCVAGGDDTEPDRRDPAEIAKECSDHFRNDALVKLFVSGADDLGVLENDERVRAAATFGVMQPTGDRFAGGSIDRIAGSPWMGRDFCERMNGGQGPLWPEWQHMFVDEELLEVATKLGVYWPRPDLVHFHRHFMRESDAIGSNAVLRPVPEHLVEANSPEHWGKYKALFEQRKAAGFPGHEPVERVLVKAVHEPRVVRNVKLDNGDCDLIEV